VICEQIARSYPGDCYLFNDLNLKIPEPQIFRGTETNRLNLLLFEEKNASLGLEIIRSIYNVYSSRVKMIERHDKAKKWYGILPTDEKFVRRWKDRATIVINNRKTSIIYEEWLEDNSVVYAPLQEFGVSITQLCSSDRIVTGIPQSALRSFKLAGDEDSVKTSSGSSFPEAVNRAEDFNRRYEDVELPDYILNDEELQDLHTRIYGWSLNE